MKYLSTTTLRHVAIYVAAFDTHMYAACTITLLQDIDTGKGKMRILGN